MTVCIEKKLLLTGGTQLFTCELLRLEPGFGVLKYIIDREYEIGGMRLGPDDITYALYWTDRPYTLYIWRFTENRAAYYFNIADTVSLTPGAVIWRDLVVDVFIDADKRVHVLDEDELPARLSPALISYIQSAKQIILAGYPGIIREADALINAILQKNSA